MTKPLRDGESPTLVFRQGRWRRPAAGRRLEAKIVAYEEEQERLYQERVRASEANLERSNREFFEARRKAVQFAQRRRAHFLSVPINDLTLAHWTKIQAAWQQRCAYCGCSIKDYATIDHVIPISRGGNHTASNIVPACKSCNSRKGARDAPPFRFEPDREMLP